MSSVRGIASSHESQAIDSQKKARTLEESQEVIYRFLISQLKNNSTEAFLIVFKNLFSYCADGMNSHAMQALCNILLEKNEQNFRYTLKRSCYITINNWEAMRNYQGIQQFINMLGELQLRGTTLNALLCRLQTWINNFINGPEYQEIKLFSSRHGNLPKCHWSSRYTSYLLVPQYEDTNNPTEQREAAKALSQQLKARFKFDLAMYTARSDADSGRVSLKNPTALGDGLVRFIKKLVTRKGEFSYKNLAHLFKEQIEDFTYRQFKQSFVKYLVFGIESQGAVDILNGKFAEKLSNTYPEKDEELIEEDLLLRTCTRVIEYLTTEDRSAPSSLFAYLIAQSNPLVLVVILLKIILVCPYARNRLEFCIAYLIQYYMQYPEEECQWVVNFFETFNITLTIYAENVQYNLVEVKNATGNNDKEQKSLYRIFSQVK